MGKMSATKSPLTAILSPDSRRLKEKENEIKDFVMFIIYYVNPHEGIRSSDDEDEEVEFCESLMQKILN